MAMNVTQLTKKEAKMAKTLSQTTGSKIPEKKFTAKSAPKPKKLSKMGEWRKKHPHGDDVIYIDWKAVLK
jgi:hypothetical protein